MKSITPRARPSRSDPSQKTTKKPLPAIAFADPIA
jgi:hypothetical protein